MKTEEQTDTTIASVTTQVKRLSENVLNLESDDSLVKNVKNILSKQLPSIEHKKLEKTV